jgi:hypothetical protein
MLSHKEGSKLHDKIADAYRNSIDLMDDHGEYNAAILNSARQFLRDNNILMDSSMGTPLNDLNNTLINVPFGEDDAAEA